MNGQPSESASIVKGFVSTNHFPDMKVIRVDERFTSKMASVYDDSGLKENNVKIKHLLMKFRNNNASGHLNRKPFVCFFSGLEKRFRKI
jgi:putative Holliday junction resolvase